MEQDIKLQEAGKIDIPTLVEFLGGLFVLEKDFTFESELQETALLSW